MRKEITPSGGDNIQNFEIECFHLALFESAHVVPIMTSILLQNFAWLSKKLDIRHNDFDIE